MAKVRSPSGLLEGIDYARIFALSASVLGILAHSFLRSSHHHWFTEHQAINHNLRTSDHDLDDSSHSLGVFSMANVPSRVA